MEGMKVFFAVMILGLAVAFLWNHIPLIKESVHSLLDPSVGKMLDWNVDFGFLIIVAFFTLLTTLLQKYFTDQKLLKEIREEQKLIQAEVKKYKDNPEKALELNQKSMELVFKTLPLTMRPLLFTSIPFILFFRWFTDYFLARASQDKLLGLFSTCGGSWIWAYLLVSIAFSSLFRKTLKVH